MPQGAVAVERPSPGKPARGGAVTVVFRGQERRSLPLGQQGAWAGASSH